MPRKAIQQMPPVNIDTAPNVHQKYKIDNRQSAVINADDKLKQTPTVVAQYRSATPVNSYSQHTSTSVLFYSAISWFYSSKPCSSLYLFSNTAGNSETRLWDVTKT
jgi:hypothetical protein